MVKALDTSVLGRASGSLGRRKGRNILVGKFDFQSIQHLDKLILKQILFTRNLGPRISSILILLHSI